MTSPTYKMKLDLNVLNHLGLNLYSNVAAVLSEAVANAWDADATEVKVDIAGSLDMIQIADNGRGMTIVDANDRFLNVGYSKRRVEGAKSPNGRSLMGRKGIGKLSMFSVARSVLVASTKNAELHGFVMSVPALEEAIKVGGEYHPVALASDELPAVTAGTYIRLKDLRRRATNQTVSALRKRIARRFSVFSDQFKVFVNEVPVSIGDRDDLTKAQFLWEFGSSGPDANASRHVIRRASLPNFVDVDGRSYELKGWIGSARLPKDLENAESGNLNSIVVLAHGRLIQENILDRLNIGGLFTKYLTGQIEADFLDLDDQEDIATSDRQRIIEDDPRYIGLLAFVRTSLNLVERQWADWRAELGTKEVVELYPRIAGWLAGLPSVSRSHAKRVIGAIQALPIENEDERRQLLRHGVMSFERLRLNESTERLANAIETQAVDLLPLIGEQDQLEASLYLDIVRSRLTVINRFMKLVDGDEKEKVLQEFLFDHLWLLDPAWERAAGSERMEQRVNKEFAEIDADLTDEERAGRIDIKYRTTAGKHVIIELKRYSVVPSVFDLGKQGSRYLAATRKLLAEAGRHHEQVEIVFVIGGKTRENDPSRDSDVVAALPGRLRTYEELIQGAIAGYAEFVEERAKVDAIEKLFEPLDEIREATQPQLGVESDR